MIDKEPKVSTAIIIVREDKILLGLLSNKWLYEGMKVYGVPGRSIRFGEKIGNAAARDITEDLGVSMTSHKIISVNANYALGNHFIEIGVIAEIEGDVQNRKPEDWDSWNWFNVSDLPVNLFPSATNVIESYLNQRMCVSE